MFKCELPSVCVRADVLMGISVCVCVGGGVCVCVCIVSGVCCSVCGRWIKRIHTTRITHTASHHWQHLCSAPHPSTNKIQLMAFRVWVMDANYRCAHTLMRTWSHSLCLYSAQAHKHKGLLYSLWKQTGTSTHTHTHTHTHTETHTPSRTTAFFILHVQLSELDFPPHLSLSLLWLMTSA